MDAKGTLPRLLYVGDVPIDATVAGQALLFRLLLEYPKDLLLVLEDVGRPSIVHQRLPRADYRPFDLGDARRIPGRLATLHHAWRALRCSRSASTIARLAADFRAQAVLTVAHWEGWLAGVAFARSKGLPLHLVIHDDWPNTNAWPRALRRAGDRVFAEHYRMAQSRMCVSPYMESEYRRRYGVPGHVLLPLRDPTVPCEASPPVRTSARPSRPLTIAYAGTLYTPGYTGLIRTLADALERIQGRLLLFTPLTAEAAARNSLRRPHVELRGFVPASELREALRREADGLFLPMSFLPNEAIPMSMNFPSKLTEYTAVGLPIIVQGPEGSSAVRWARSKPDVALTVIDPSTETLTGALRALATDGELWDRLAAGAISAGSDFDYEIGRDRFLQLLAGA